MMQTPVEGELFVTVVEGGPPASFCQPEGGDSSRSYLHLQRLLVPFPTLLRIPLFNLTEPLFVTSLLH